MKKLSIFICTALMLLLVSCEEDVPQYRVGTTTVIPDSSQQKIAEFIVQLMSATSFHMTTSDYEDPEDVIAEARRTAYQLYSVQIPCLQVKYPNLYWADIDPCCMTERQKQVFEELNKKQ
jgi:hypothetical protein